MFETTNFGRTSATIGKFIGSAKNLLGSTEFSISMNQELHNWEKPMPQVDRKEIKKMPQRHAKMTRGKKEKKKKRRHKTSSAISPSFTQPSVGTLDVRNIA